MYNVLLFVTHCQTSLWHLLVSCYFVRAEQDMERKVQEHKQELERLQQATKLDKQKLIHEAKLKKEASSVRFNLVA